MSKVIGYFKQRETAETAVRQLRQRGFEGKISLIAKEDMGNGGGNQDISDGVLTGGVLGGIAGLALGAGALFIPGIGPLVVAGPLSGIISGALTGGIAGGLIDYGIPEERSKHYEQKVREGNILAVIEADEQRAGEVADLLKSHGAQEVESHR
ncbi:MAG: hypothetical protein ACOXZ5_09295 [Syntrophomonadaceae bacterium]